MEVSTYKGFCNCFKDLFSNLLNSKSINLRFTHKSNSTLLCTLLIRNIPVIASMRSAVCLVLRTNTRAFPFLASGFAPLPDAPVAYTLFPRFPVALGQSLL